MTCVYANGERSTLPSRIGKSDVNQGGGSCRSGSVSRSGSTVSIPTPSIQVAMGQSISAPTLVTSQMPNNISNVPNNISSVPNNISSVPNSIPTQRSTIPNDNASTNNLPNRTSFRPPPPPPASDDDDDDLVVLKSVSIFRCLVCATKFEKMEDLENHYKGEHMKSASKTTNVSGIPKVDDDAMDVDIPLSQIHIAEKAVQLPIPQLAQSMPVNTVPVQMQMPQPSSVQSQTSKILAEPIAATTAPVQMSLTNEIPRANTPVYNLQMNGSRSNSNAPSVASSPTLTIASSSFPCKICFQTFPSNRSVRTHCFDVHVPSMAAIRMGKKYEMKREIDGMFKCFNCGLRMVGSRVEKHVVGCMKR
jgi:hypothetical protein